MEMKLLVLSALWCSLILGRIHLVILASQLRISVESTERNKYFPGTFIFTCLHLLRRFEMIVLFTISKVNLA